MTWTYGLMLLAIEGVLLVLWAAVRQQTGVLHVQVKLLEQIRDRLMELDASEDYLPYDRPPWWPPEDL